MIIYKKSKRSTRVSEVMKSGLEDLALGVRLREYRLFQAWSSIVGETLADKVQPQRLFRDTLYLTASSTAWITELRYLKLELLEKINDFINEENFEVKDLVIHTGIVKKREKAKKKFKPRKKVLKKQELEFITNSLTGIKDPALLRTIKRAMKRSFQDRTEESKDES
ncbi:MAG: DUF721 domain-containing protein [Deltaproteobacteria bacterium]|nr:DUF721 domain-containing protein [Deltaproteobacteria bacterium]